MYVSSPSLPLTHYVCRRWEWCVCVFLLCFGNIQFKHINWHWTFFLQLNEMTIRAFSLSRLKWISMIYANAYVYTINVLALSLFYDLFAFHKTFEATIFHVIFLYCLFILADSFMQTSWIWFYLFSMSVRHFFLFFTFSFFDT